MIKFLENPKCDRCFFKSHKSLSNLDESGHFLESVGPANDGSLAGVALASSRDVMGNPLVVTVVTDDVALQDYQLVEYKKLFSIFIVQTWPHC